MKHPALTRAMAFILAIVSIILLLVGNSGLKKAEQLKEEELAEYEKFAERIELYKKLSKELEGLEAYKSADETLSEKETQHDKDAAQHRTDVATHTATEGGYKSGADQLWEARALLQEKSGEYYAGLQTFNSKKAEFDQMKAMAEGIPLLAGGCKMASAQAAVTVPVSDPGEAPTEPEAPTPPEAPTEPPMPIVPVEPTAPALPDRASYESDEAFDQAMADYDVRKQIYDDLKAKYDADIINYANLKTQYDMDMETYKPLKTQYDADMLVYSEKKAIYDGEKAQYDIDKAAWDSASAAYQDYAGKLAGWTALMQQGAGIMAAMGSAPPSTTPDAAGLAAMGAALEQMYAAIQPQIKEGEAALAEAEAGLDAAKKALDEADWKIQSNLENIWYHMGKLEDEAVELSEEKETLSKTSEELEAERQLLEKQKETENKLSSTRILLMKNKAVAEAVEAGGELVDSALKAADAMEERSAELYEGRLMVAYLSIIAGGLGLLVLPSAFELIRSRFLLITPALFGMAAAACCVYINYRLGEGSYYAAMPMVVFAFFYLLAALPKKKVIKNK